MMEFLYDQALDVGGDVGIGVAFWLLAFALPFRALSARAEVGWDVLGYFGSFAAGMRGRPDLYRPLGLCAAVAGSAVIAWGMVGLLVFLG